MISRSTTYIKLVEKVSQVINIDTLEFEIKIKFKLKMSSSMLLVIIKTNDDVEFFLEKITGEIEFRNLLCVTF